MGSNLELIDCYPGVMRKLLKHWDKEHETTRPVDNKEHHADEVEDLHEHPDGLEQLR